MKKQIYYAILGALLAGSSYAQTSCSTAIQINPGIHIVDTIIGIPHTSSCVGSGTFTRSEWYSFTPTETVNATVSSSFTQNSAVDTRLSIYYGNCASGIGCVGGDDDGGMNQTSVVNFTAIGGVTYYIVWDNRYSGRGFTFELSTTPYVGEPLGAPLLFNMVPMNLPGSYRIAVADMNGDFKDDIVTISQNSVTVASQYENNTFITTTFPTNIQFLPGWSMAIGDLDGNGYNDMVLGAGNGVSFLYARPNGYGYDHVAEDTYVFSQRTNMVDINNDGNLDAFVCHDVAPNVYYLNDGTGALTYHQGGIGDHPNGGNYGSVWFDYNNDGKVDLFIAKCRGGASTAKLNQLFRNNGDGTFTEVSVEANMNHPNQSWSAAIADFDGDGYMDVFAGANAMTDGGHILMLNNQDGTFTDAIDQTNINPFADGSAEWVSFDFDNNGWPDIYSTGNKLLLNQGDLTFVNSGLNFGYGSVGDLNDDGFLDFYVNDRVYFQMPNGNNWLKVNVKGIQSNINGIGARVEMYAGGRMQIRDIQSGTGFRHMHTMNAHFGLGTVNQVDSVIVRWPSGMVDVMRDVDINGSLLVVEGNSSLGNLQVALEGVTMYPNPTSGELKIANIENHDVKEILVVSLAGQVVYQTTSDFKSLDLSNLTTGMYVVNVILAEGKAYNELITISK